jgi:hypothetical protein
MPKADRTAARSRAISRSAAPARGLPLAAVFLTLISSPLARHFANAPGPKEIFGEAVCIWIAPALIWIGYFPQRSH